MNIIRLIGRVCQATIFCTTVVATASFALGTTATPQQFGAKGDCISDDYAAFRTMFASGKSYHIPAVRFCYVIAVPASGHVVFALPAAATLDGDGRRSKLDFTISAGGYYRLFSASAADQTFRNFAIEVKAAKPVAQITVFAQAADNLDIESLTIDGGMSSAGAQRVYPLQFVGATNGTHVSNVAITRTSALGLKRNSDTFPTRNVYFRGLITTSMYGPVGLNSPGGPAQNVVVEQSTFGTNLNPGQESYLVGFSSVKNLRVVRNRFPGSSKSDALHLEEANDDATIFDNSIEGPHLRGIFFTDGNHRLAGGRNLSPTTLKIVGNVVRSLAHASIGKDVGVYIHIADPQNDGPFRIEGRLNRVDRYTRCFIADNVPSTTLLVQDNIFSHCGLGIYLKSGTLDVRNNDIIDTKISLQVDNAVSISPNRVINSQPTVQRSSH